MKYIHLYLISYPDLSTVMWKFIKNKTILYSRTENVGKDVITNHHTDREKEPAKQLFHKTLMRSRVVIKSRGPGIFPGY